MKNTDLLEYLDGRHYDAKVESRKLIEDIPFYVKNAKDYGDPILELACGTGRVTIPIAQNKLSITGLDILSTMLKEAKRKSKEVGVKIKWIEADMTNFDLNKKFNLILIPGCAFNALIDLKSVEDCLICVKKHLKSNGGFIFDAFNPNLDILVRDPSKFYPNAEYQDPDGRGLVSVKENTKYDKANQMLLWRLTYSIEDKIISKSNEMKLRIFFPQELDAILKYNGFEIKAKYGDSELKPFEPNSRRQIFICEVKN
ncbi:MAG: class I SAM-dependent DNA methyltransferase [Candidatus Hodarchaeota archaeon]